MKARLYIVAALLVVLSGSPLLYADWQTGMAAYQKGDYAAAVTAFSEVVTTNPEYAGAYFMLGRCQQLAGNLEAAVPNLRTALDKDDSNLDYRLALGQGLVDSRSYEEATQILAQVSPAAVPERQRTWVALMRAQAAVQTGDHALAIELLTARLKQADGSAPLHRALGFAHRAAGNLEQAFAELLRAFDLDPKDSSVGRRAAETAMDLAATRAGDKESWYLKALQVAERVATASPSFAHFRLAGEAALGASRWQQAVAWFEKASTKKPGDTLTAFYLGRSLGGLEQDERAIEVLEKGLGQGPSGELAGRMHGQIARILARNLELDKAVVHFEQAGDTDNAAQIRQTAEQIGEVLKSRDKLKASLDEVRALQAELEKLNDTDGVKAMQEKAATFSKDLADLEQNLTEVREALRKM